MPSLFRIACSSCAARPAEQVEGGFAGAVVHGDPHEGTLTQGWHRAVLARDGRLIPMRHPIESAALEEAGTTELGAFARGRLVYVEQVLCLDCGTLNERHTLTWAPSGLCLSFPAVLVAWPVLLRTTESPVVWHLLVTVALLAPWFVVPRVLTLLRPPCLPSGECPCGSRRWVAVDRAAGRTLPCPICKQDTLAVTEAGRS